MGFVNYVLTSTTCGEGCWYAREDVCRCSCGGINHGCLKTEDGIKPIRTSNIDGSIYELKAIGTWRDLEAQAKEINKAAGHKMVDKVTETLIYHYDWKSTDKGAPARVKSASKDQIARWEELSSFRAMDRYELFRNQPYLLWVKK